MPKPVRLQLSRRKGFDLQALSMATNGLPAGQSCHADVLLELANQEQRHA